jgi:hypothetical protein
LGFHAQWKDAHGKKMLTAPEDLLLAYIEHAKKYPIYRIKINEDGSVETDCYELLDNFQPELEKCYEGVDELPKWVQDKLAVLMLLDHNQHDQEVETVGRRISENIFWVFIGESGGDNT